MNEKTFFIIKPEASSERDRIKTFIESNSDLKIVTSRILVLDDSDIKSLYTDDIGTDLLEAARCHLSGREVEVGVVEGENAIEKFMILSGKYPDGKLCDKNTIRGKFSKDETVKYGKVTYYLNAIHKASRSEAAKSLVWYYSKLK